LVVVLGTAGLLVTALCLQRFAAASIKSVDVWDAKSTSRIGALKPPIADNARIDLVVPMSGSKVALMLGDRREL
jgi:hypothetical protein